MPERKRVQEVRGRDERMAKEAEREGDREEKEKEEEEEGREGGERRGWVSPDGAFALL